MNALTFEQYQNTINLHRDSCLKSLNDSKAICEKISKLFQLNVVSLNADLVNDKQYVLNFLSSVDSYINVYTSSRKDDLTREIFDGVSSYRIVKLWESDAKTLKDNLQTFKNIKQKIFPEKEKEKTYLFSHCEKHFSGFPILKDKKATSSSSSSSISSSSSSSLSSPSNSSSYSNRSSSSSQT